jgi:hypothetical protein
MLTIKGLCIHAPAAVRAHVDCCRQRHKYNARKLDVQAINNRNNLQPLSLVGMLADVEVARSGCLSCSAPQTWLAETKKLRRALSQEG